MEYYLTKIKYTTKYDYGYFGNQTLELIQLVKASDKEKVKEVLIKEFEKYKENGYVMGEIIIYDTIIGE